MLKNRIDLENYLTKRYTFLVLNKTELCDDIVKYIYENHNIPLGKINDIITQRVSISEVSEFILYCLLEGLEQVNHQDKDPKIAEYFSSIEIKQYSKAKEEKEKISFPLCINCIQVVPDQWIGAVDVKFFMKLRDVQMINYNINAQRTMQKVIRGEKEYYKISLNSRAINEIRDFFQKDGYIPNTITLNIPIDSDVSYKYNEKTNTLIIDKLEYFDVLDGYHRYIAMCQESDNNPNFNYPMELRIVSFSDDKARQFIFQEDQKTKMSKIDSNTMNMQSSANMVVERLNQDVMFNLKGCINRNGGQIAFADLSNLIHYFYFKGEKKGNENILRARAIRELRNKFNYLTEENPDYLSKKYTFVELAIIMYIFNMYQDNYEGMEELITKMLRQADTLSKTKIKSRIPRKPLFNEIENLIRKES